MALARELSFRLPLQRGDDVRAVQQALIRAGTLAGAADGIFGPATHRAVVDFQRRMQARHPGFAADGIVGRQSWSALFPEAAPHPLAGAAIPEVGLGGAMEWRAALGPYVQRLMAGSAPPVGQGARRQLHPIPCHPRCAPAASHRKAPHCAFPMCRPWCQSA